MFSVFKRRPLFGPLSQTLYRYSSDVVFGRAHLPSRSIMRVGGVEAPGLLQGLVTNDVKLLEEGERQSLYCAFLNVGGRILFDALVFKGQSEDELLLDIDGRCANLARKHLLMHKVRKKVDIDLLEDTKVYAIFNPEAPDLDLDVSNKATNPTQAPVIGSTYCDGGERMETLPSSIVSGLPGGCLVFPDPRLPALGYRVLLDNPQHKEDSMLQKSAQLSAADYEAMRLRLGVAEGPLEIPVGKCFPLEYNLDYLHGVSFHKGCYLGQELTARTHHTGVVRKRVLPVTLSQPLPSPEAEPEIECCRRRGGREGTWEAQRQSRNEGGSTS